MRCAIEDGNACLQKRIVRRSNKMQRSHTIIDCEHFLGFSKIFGLEVPKSYHSHHPQNHARLICVYSAYPGAPFRGSGEKPQ